MNDPYQGIRDRLAAIRNGHHVVVARITEAQAREAFQKWWAANDGTYVDAYLAGLRDAGLLIEDKP